MEYFATVADKRFIVDWEKLPMASKERVIRYGVQRIINDRCGGSDRTPDEKHDIAAKMIEALVSGTMPTRGNGDGADSVTKRMRKNLKAIIRERKPERYKELNATCADAKAWAAELDKIIAAQKPETQAAMRDTATKQLEAERKEAEKARAVDVDVSDI